MRSSLVMSLIGATSMALALLVGCGDDDNKPAASKAGESCVRTADCVDGLSCIGNVCYKTVPPAAGGGAGTGPVEPVPPPLGGEGESCTSRLDCIESLACFNNRCTAPASGDAGATGGTGVQLGVRGESCRVNSDCSQDLVCVATAVAGTGVCDLASFGVIGTGLTCSGECTKAEDCCQLPMALHTTSIRSCQDIADAIAKDSIDCSTPAAGAPAKLCFQQATYCECGDDTWSCDEDTHACLYGTECDPAAGQDAPDGCPTRSRLYDITVKTCNPDSKTCIGAATVATNCTNDKSCLGMQVVDSSVDDLCTADECTCYAGNKQCYRKCARDIDCGAGQICDAKLCKPDAACVSDSQCAIANHNVAFKCNDGTCAQSCTTDRDCSPSGVAGAFTGRVCSADGFCASLAQDCNEDSQCAPLTVGGLKPFCVEPAPAGGAGVSSAITN